MNNKNQKNMKPDNVAKEDHGINTKKGFLISLPKKKKNDSGNVTSGIVMAKTVNNAPKPKQQNERPQGAKPDKNSGAKNTDNTKNNIHGAENAHRKNNSQRHDRHGGKQRHQKHKDFSATTQKNDTNIKNNNQVNQNTNSAPSVKHENFERNRNKHHNDHRMQAQNQQTGGKKNNDRRDRNKDRRPQSKFENMPGLSPLSKEMQSFAKITDADIAKFADKDKKELSLEEKYANAIPLAEQIAMEEEKRRVKPKSMQTAKIDRNLTANELHAKAQESEETANKTDFGMDYEVVGIRFREAGKIYYFDPDGNDIPYGTPVIVETSRGTEYGYTAISNRLVPPTGVIPPLKKIKRIATAEDTEKYKANKRLEADAAEVFKQKVSALGLEMNLVFVEYTFDNTKLLFYFTAETRIDFRELVKELAAVFRTRIELRQIGVRDEAKMLGGLGVCGRNVCCSSFLGDFAQVSIKMAKDQGLSLNSAKISGACGKLMCCLRYEDKVYEEEMSRTPKVGSIVETEEGRGVVTEANALKGIVKVTLDSAPDSPPKPFDRTLVKVVGFNKNAVKDETSEDLKALEDNT